MERKFWAVRGTKKVGPYATREAAVAAFRESFPFTKAAYLARDRKNQITTGYGEAGPHFDIRWDNAA